MLAATKFLHYFSLIYPLRLLSNIFLNMPDTSLDTLPQDYVTKNSTKTENVRKKSKKPRLKPDKLKEYYKRLSKNVKTIKILERLSDYSAKHVDIAINLLTTTQITRKLKVY